MNEKKLQKLFEAARRETIPAPPAGFAGTVMREVGAARQAGSPALAEALEVLFPRLVFAAAAFIGLCVVADICGSALEDGGLPAALSEIHSQWLFATE